MLYSIPDFQNFWTYALWANDVTGGWYWSLMLIAFCIIGLTSLATRYEYTKALTAMLLVGFLAGVFLDVVGLVNNFTVGTFLAGVIIMIFVNVASSRGGN